MSGTEIYSDNCMDCGAKMRGITVLYPEVQQRHWDAPSRDIGRSTIWCPACAGKRYNRNPLKRDLSLLDGVERKIQAIALGLTQDAHIQEDLCQEMRMAVLEMPTNADIGLAVVSARRRAQRYLYTVATDAPLNKQGMPDYSRQVKTFTDVGLNEFGEPVDTE